MNDVYPDGDGELKEFNVDEWRAVISFIDWWKDAQPVPISFEQMCWNEADDYAGTIDFVCEIAGVRYVVDFKTSKSVWPSHELQIASYVNTPQAQGATQAAILQIGYTLNKRGWKFNEVDELPEKYETFKAVKRVWWNENKDVHPKQYQLPDSLSLEPTEQPSVKKNGKKQIRENA
jgi:hypothetical protein